tara:strand:+ start:3083 stop:4777 length:1695 start_codon:yes stop_codon:yes gene_type:complete
MIRMKSTFKIILLIFFISLSFGTEPEYGNFSTTIVKNIDLNYLLYIPDGYTPSEAWPLVLFLTGKESTSNINYIRSVGLAALIENGLEYDYFLAAPQLPENMHWDPDAIMALVDHLEDSYHIDDVYLFATGIGDIGGFGVWETAVSFPTTFSKIAPMGAPACTEICRVGAPSIRIFHGLLDEIVPVEDAENMYFELDYYCDNDNLEITVYDSLEHNVWDHVYTDDQFLEWLTGSSPTYGANSPMPQSLSLFTTFSKSIEDNYLLYLPVGYEESNSSWPLVIFLHGAGSAITNIDEIRHGGPPLLYEQGMNTDFIMLCPQLYDNVHWDPDRIHVLTQEIISQYLVDPSRVYLTGLSRGGFGAWEYGVSHPNMFAAVVPISARDVPGVERLENTNVWIFHGDQDTGVPWQGAQFMYNRLNKIGADVNLTLYEGVGHNAWDLTYNSDSFWTWLLQQQNDMVANTETGTGFIQDSSLLQNYPNPSNPSTTIKWVISETHHENKIRIEIFNMLGQKVKTLANLSMTAGTHEMNWNGKTDSDSIVSSGTYFARMMVNEKMIDSHKINVVK